MRETVRKLAGYFPTAIASGRCRDKVYSFVRLAKLYYAGSHGMDIKGPSKGSKYKKRAVTMFLLIFYYSVSHVSSVDTLKQGNRLNSSRQLVSADGVFTLGFYSLENTNNSYLGVWFTDDSYGPIWLGNRDKPITDNSGVLTISSTRKLIINSSGGDPIELYANENGINIMATLLNSGNFVVKEIDINGSGDRVLWQSFDYPTDTLLPGMKLGINHRTQRNWSITSWFSQNNPVAGAFTLEWDPSRHRLIIRRRGVAYWTSGELTDYIDEDRPDLKLKKFENIGYKYDPYNSIYNFVNVTNDDEDYMSYLFEIDPVLTTDELKISAWKLDSEGFMYDHNRMVIVDVQRCYGYNTQEGCELWGQPKCRNHKETFALRSGHFIPTSDSYILDDNSSRLTESDCRGYCWNDCECVGYTAGTESGCVYWKGKNLTFVQSLDGSEVRKHILISEPAKKGKKKMIWITIAVVTTVVLLLLGSSWFMMHKIIERKLEEELEKMITLEKYTGTDELDNDGRKGHNHIPVVSVYGYVDAHASRLAARNSISSENKPGEGGFGPVYEGDGRRARNSSQSTLTRVKSRIARVQNRLDTYI